MTKGMVVKDVCPKSLILVQQINLSGVLFLRDIVFTGHHRVIYNVLLNTLPT